ncbi:MAG: hypothetical protein HUU02_03230 [Bacteroidetes bacterium]|nr:hypothetical protein [Bacteroidota bacterium]
MTATNQVCLVCGQSQQQVPLIAIAYQNTSYHICPQHLPMLIHKPELLAGKLPGAEGMKAAEHHD